MKRKHLKKYINIKDHSYTTYNHYIYIYILIMTRTIMSTSTICYFYFDKKKVILTGVLVEF